MKNIMIISKKDFVNLIESFQKFQDYIDQFYKLKIDIIESELHEYPCKLFENITRLLFDEDGVDWIDYYLYELPHLGEGEHIFDKDNNPIPLKNIDDLWNLVKDCRK